MTLLQFRLRKRLSTLVLFLSSFLGCLIVAELMVRFLAPQNMFTSFQVSDERGLFLNPNAGSAIHQSAVGGRIVHYRFSNPHLRGDSPNPRKKQILILGDSFTFGWLLEEDKTYVSFLQRKLDEEGTNYQLLNAAVGGWGGADILAYLEDYSMTLHLERIIVFLNIDDIDRLYLSSLYKISEDGILIKGKNEKSRARTILDASPIYRYLIMYSHLANLVRDVYVTRRDSSDNRRAAAQTNGIGDNLLLARAVYKKMKGLADNRGIRLTIITTGWPQSPSSILTTRFMIEAKDFFASQNIDFCDLRAVVTPRINAQRSSFELVADGHPNELGARVIGEAAWSCIKSRL